MMKKILHYMILGVVTLLALPELTAQNVGIGTNTPLQKLDVNGNSLVRDSLSVGIYNPRAKLDVLGTVLFRAGNLNAPPDPLAAFEFFTGRNADGSKPSGLLQSDIAFGYGGAGGGFRHYLITRHNFIPFLGQNAFDFYVNTSSVAGSSSAPDVGNIPALSITDAGIGIGTKGPNHKLHVIGNTLLNGKLSVGSNPPNISSNTPTLNVNGSALFKGGNPDLLDSLPRAGVEFFFGRAGVSNDLPGNYQNGDIAFNYGVAPGGLRHFIATRHYGAANNIGNAIDFYINNSSNPFASKSPGVGNKLAFSINTNCVNIPDGNMGLGVLGDVGERLYVNGDTRITNDLFVQGTTIMGYNTSFQDYLAPGNTLQVYIISCPAGQRLINGGGGVRDFNPSAQFVTINYNGPDTGSPSTAWRIAINNTDLLPKTIRIYCNCARIN